MEIELKLLMDPADLARVGHSGAVSRARRGRARSATLHTIYYDTPDGLLWRGGVALRLRRTGSRWIQTVKGAGEAIGGLHRREEIEWPVATGALDLDLLAGTPFAKLFLRPRVRQGLSSIFETEFRRRSIELELSDGTKATLCLDSGEIRAGASVEPICEVEVELVQGEITSLLDFARDLLLERPFRISTHSKAQRGHILAASTQNSTTPARSGDIDLAGIAGTSEAFVRIVQSAAEQVHDNERGVLESNDPEYLHQTRVGLRRLRVALSLPGDEAWEAASRPLRDRFRALSRVLGEARNWYVFAGEMLRPMAAHTEAKILAGLRARAGLRRVAALAAARNAIQSRETTQLWLDLARLMMLARADTNGRTRDFAASSLKLRYLGMFKAAEQVDSAGKLHELRIAAKKLRYVCEFFADLYPRKKVKRFLSTLSVLQDELGAVNDAAVSRVLLGKADAGARPLGAEARGMALGWIAAYETQARARAQAAAKLSFNEKPFWK